MKAAGSQIGALLLPYIHAKHEADSERLLAALVSEYVEPVIRQVIRSKLRVRFDRRGRASNNPDAEDLYPNRRGHPPLRPWRFNSYYRKASKLDKV